MMNATGVAGENAAHAAMNTALTPALTTSTGRKPKRLRILAATVFMVKAPRVAENVIRPDWNGVILKPTCSNSGSRNGSAPIPQRKRNPPSTLARNVGSLSSEKSSTGAATRRA